MKHSSARSLLVTTASLLAGVTLSAQGAEWDTGGAISVSTYATDNVCRSNLDKQDETYATVTPSADIRGRGARANVSLSGAVQYNSLAEKEIDCPAGSGIRGGGNRSAFRPRGRLAGDLELVENWLIVDAYAAASQNRSNPFLAGGEDNLDATRNLNTTTQYGASATAQRRLPVNADFLLRYGYNEQQNDARGLQDSSQEQVQFSLLRTPGTGRLTGGVQAAYSNVTFNGRDQDIGDGRLNREAELSSAQLQAGFQLTRAWQINGTVGEEWNQFFSINEDIDGTFWDVGVQWTPNSRINVAAGWGERFFGNTPRAQISYRHKRSGFNLAYVRSVNYGRNLRTQDVLEDDFVIDPDLPLEEQGTPTISGNGVLINEQFSAGYTLFGRRSTFTLSGRDSKQFRAVDGSSARFSGVAAVFTRSLSSRLSFVSRLSWDERRNLGGGLPGFRPNSETWGLRLDLQRRVGQFTSVNVGYSYLSRESENAFNEFDENRFVISIRRSFR